MKPFFLGVVVFFLLVPAAIAVRVNSIYSAEMPVATQTIQEKNRVLPLELGQVLIKVSGNSHILDNPKIKMALPQAESLLQDFSYVASSQKEASYLLKIHFDPEGVNHLLRDAGVPLWGAERPLILGWVEYEIPDHVAEIIGADSSNPLRLSLKQEAERRGLPFILPMMDITDLNQITVNDIVTMHFDPLLNAAKRYASDAILVIRLFSLTTGFSSQATLVVGNDKWGWHIIGKNSQDVIAALMDNVADTLAKRFSVVMTDTVQHKIILKINSVKQQDDLKQMMQYLQHLTMVTDVQLVQITGDTVLLNVNLRTNSQSFKQMLEADHHMTPISSTDAILTYQWNP